MACILLWMAGGPSQMETFDPKPGTANGGDTKAIDTAVPGIKIANGWNKLAKVMNDVAMIRSMTNKEGNHQRATYQLHTGYAPTGTVKHPNIGCVVANELGDPKFDLPHIVSIGSGTIGAGLLGVALEPFVVQDPTKPPANVIPAVTGAAVLAPAQPAARAGALGLRDDRRRRPRQGPHGALSPDGRHGPLAPDEGLRPRRRRPQDPRRLRRDRLRPGLPARPPAGPGGRDVRRGPLQRLGHPPAERTSASARTPAASTPGSPRSSPT